MEHIADVTMIMVITPIVQPPAIINDFFFL